MTISHAAEPVPPARVRSCSARGSTACSTRKHTVLVLMSVELMLAAVNINLVAFGAYNDTVAGQVFALFVLTIAAAEVGVGLAIVLLIYRNLHSADLDDVDVLKG